MTLPDALLHFFDDYCAAFNALDGTAVAALYALPSALAQGEQFAHWHERDAIVANMTTLCAYYREHGFRTARYLITGALPQGPNHAVVDIAWQIERNAGLPTWTFRTGYNMVRTPDGWRIRLCTAYEEANLHVGWQPVTNYDADLENA